MTIDSTAPANQFGPVDARSRLTTDRHRAIVAAVNTGMAVERAAAIVQVSRRTIYDWLARGRNADHQARLADHVPDDNPDDPPGVDDSDRAYWRLWHDVEVARAQAVQDALLTIRQASRGWETVETTETVKRVPLGGGQFTEERTIVTRTGTTRHWQAAAWWLERVLPNEFGRRTRHEVTGAEGGPVEVAAFDARQEAERILTETAERLGLPSALPNGQERALDRPLPAAEPPDALSPTEGP